MTDPEEHEAEAPESPCNPKRGPAKYLPKRERKGIALCLSGGGYRAALFHLGAMRRLNELGAIPRLDTVSAVSGGSILAGFLAKHVSWPVATSIPDFDQLIARPFRDFTKKNIRTAWVLERLARPWDSTVGVQTLVRRYWEDIAPDLMLHELRERPRFIFSATDLAFGTNWVSERERVGSRVPGYVEPPPPDWSVARAIAASSCFPPVFEPLPIDLDPGLFRGGRRPAPDEDRHALIDGLRLSDGGVFDNMGLEPVWKGHEVLLVSNGGATFDFKADRSPFARLSRYGAIQGAQVELARKRWLMSNFSSGKLRGAYWGIGSAVTNYDTSFQGYDEAVVDQVISEVRTDLDHFTDAEAEVLQNHGYLLADAAIRCHQRDLCAPDAPAPQVPFPARMDSYDVRRALAKSHKRRILGRWRLWPFH